MIFNMLNSVELGIQARIEFQFSSLNATVTRRYSKGFIPNCVIVKFKVVSMRKNS